MAFWRWGVEATGLCHEVGGVADAEAFLLTGGHDLGLAHTDDGDSVSHGVEDFQFIARFLAGGGLVLLDYGGKVPPAETEGRNVLRQDDVAEEFVLHGEDGGGTLNVERRTSNVEKAEGRSRREPRMARRSRMG